MISPFKSAISRIDTRVDTYFQKFRGNPPVDKTFYLASELADFSKAWHVIGAGLALTNPALRKHWLRLAITLGVESALVNGGLKNIFNRQRPEISEDLCYEVRRPKTTSFPSGHASSATVAALLLSKASPKLSPVWVVLATTVAVSRIHNRMHHTSDVAAGTIVGIGIAAVAKKLWDV